MAALSLLWMVKVATQIDGLLSLFIFRRHKKTPMLDSHTCVGVAGPTGRAHISYHEVKR